MERLLLISSVMLWIVVAALAFSVITLIRHLNIQLRNENMPGIEIGGQLPDVSLSAVDRTDVLLLDNFRGRPLLLVFVRPGCPRCHALMPTVERLSTEHGSEVQVAVVSVGSRENGRIFAVAAGLMTCPVYADVDKTVSAAFRIGATPVGLLFNAKGILVDKFGSTAPAQFYQRLMATLHSLG